VSYKYAWPYLRLRAASDAARKAADALRQSLRDAQYEADSARLGAPRLDVVHTGRLCRWGTPNRGAGHPVQGYAQEILFRNVELIVLVLYFC